MIKYCQLCTDHGLRGKPFDWHKEIPIERYVRESCKFLEEDYNLVVSKIRKQEIVQTRFMVMTYLHCYIHLPLKKIGHFFNRDHTTVIHARQTVYSLCFTEPDYKKRYQELVDHLNKLQ